MRANSTPQRLDKRSSNWRPSRHPRFYETANQICEVFSRESSESDRDREVLTTLLFQMATHMLAQRSAGQLAKYLYLAIGNAWQFYRQGSSTDEQLNDPMDRQTVKHHARLLYALEIVLDDPNENIHRNYTDGLITEEVDRLFRQCKAKGSSSGASVVNIATWRRRSIAATKSKPQA